MAQAIEYAARLTETIGARPAGTEEEQQASFFIDEVLREEAGLATEIEEFNCSLGYELPRTVCCIATAVLGILSLFLTLMVIPSVIITLITAVLFILDSLGHSPFARIGNSGISQNILAKYTPQTDAGTRGRKRKVLVVAHYDSGKVRIEAKGAMLSALPYLYILELVGMALVPLALLIRFVTSATAGLLVVLNVITVIGVVLALLPVFGFLIHQTAQYNRGANVNASGVAVLLECAKRIGEEPEELMADAVMHGEEELRADLFGSRTSRG
jgi:NADH:ubiquinone oxidoreductase subunit 3 (subunit A)